jgi:protein-tyrosine-phosphatase
VRVENPDITDPIGADGEVFQAVFQDLETELKRVAYLIVNESMEKF